MPMPLLWVVPLGLYLLSFTIAFSTRGGVAEFLAILAPYLLVPAAIALLIGQHLPLPVNAGILLAALFAISVACHLRIYQSRPEPDQLTGFYLVIAVGGALGGLFCALLAPLIFDWTYEYPLLLFAAAVTLIPGYSLIIPSRWLQRRKAAAVILGASVVIVASGDCGCGDLGARRRRRPLRFNGRDDHRTPGDRQPRSADQYDDRRDDRHRYRREVEAVGRAGADDAYLFRRLLDGRYRRLAPAAPRHDPARDSADHARLGALPDHLLCRRNQALAGRSSWRPRCSARTPASRWSGSVPERSLATSSQISAGPSSSSIRRSPSWLQDQAGSPSFHRAPRTRGS